MVSCPFFLRLKGLLFKKEGATLTEILISVTVVALLAVLLLSAFQPQTQVMRSQDAKRKADVTKLQNILEDYYNDHNCYPARLDDLVPDYINPLPRDPKTGELYAYYLQGCDIYRIYVALGYTEDPDIIKAGCELGCGPGGDAGGYCDDYNYGVCSSNATLESCTGACSGQLYACQGAGCNVWGGQACTGLGRIYCKTGCPGGPECCDYECGTCAACCTDCTPDLCL